MATPQELKTVKDIMGSGSIVPPLNLASSSSAYSGPLTTSSLFDASGFSVNYGNGVSQGAGGAASIPNWVWVAAAAVGALFWKQIRASVKSI